MFPYLQLLFDALCWFAKFVDDLNDFEVDAIELHCIQFDKERVCWLLRMNIFAVIF